MPRARADYTGLIPARATTLAISSRAIFIFIGPTATSKVSSSKWRNTLPSRPSDFSRTVSPIRDLLDYMLLGVGIAGVGAGAVRHDGGIELLAEFAAHLGDAALGVFRQLQCLRAVLNRVHGLARAILEVAQHAVQLLLQLAHLLALLLAAFRREMIALARQLLLRARSSTRSLSISRSSECSRSRKRETSCACEVCAVARWATISGFKPKLLRDVDAR